MATLNEERRLVTVLFADIVGFTGLVEHLDPERTKRLIDDALERIIADVHAYGGSVDKVLGDGVLAVFGAPVAHEDDPDRAVRAAMQMHESLAEFASENKELERRVQLRVGINTGEVLFGRIAGTDDFTVLGDVVNVASRIETLASAGEVYVGDATAALTSSAVELDVVDDLDVRGREQSETVWRAVGFHSQPVANATRDTPFVGRKDQRQLLALALSRVTAGRSAVVAVSGEAGSGKTRLVSEALADLEPGVVVLAGQCAPYGENNVWSPIATAMFGSIDPRVSASADQLRELCRARIVAEYGVDKDDVLLGRIVEGVLHVAGYASKVDDLAPAQAREALFRLIVEALRQRTTRAPVVLWIDDLQWADQLLIDLLHRITRSLVDRRFLLITAQRDDASIEWPPASNHPVTVRMPLEPLARDEADALVQAITGASTEPYLATQLYERSGGNPLFLTELASLAGTDLDPVALPTSLRVLIAARLDRLLPAHRMIIDNAAVLGSDGDIASLETFAAEMGQAFHRDDLRALERDGLLDVVHNSWRFRSDVVREVAYQTLTKVSRAQRHVGVAQVMTLFPGSAIASTAHHTARAAELNREIGPIEFVPVDIGDQAVVLLHKTAQRSLEVGAFRQARTETTRALDLDAASSSMVRQLRLLRATASTELREFEPARKDSLSALESAIEDGDRYDEGIARRLLGVQAHGVGNLGNAHQELDASIAIFRDLGDDIQLSTSLADRGFSEIFGGSLDEADVLLDEAEELAERLGDYRAGAWAREHKALVAFLSGDVELATQRLDIAARQFEGLGDRAGLSWTQSLRAYVAFYERRFDDAEALAVEARAESRKLGERWGPAMMDTLVASIRLWTGNFAEAESLAGRSLATFRELGDRFGTVQSLAPHVRSLVALGRYQDAEREIEEALTLSESSGSFALPLMVAAGSAVHLGLGDRSVVISELALERIKETGSDGSEVRTALALALCQSGRADESLEHLLAVENDRPYTSAVRALAFALIGDPAQSLEAAALVTVEAGATYLDRVIAHVAAAGSEMLRGDPVVAAAQLGAARDLG